MVRLRVVNIKLERPALVSLDEAEQVLRLVEDRISPDDEVGMAPEPGGLGGAVRVDVKNVPDVLIRSLERAEPDGDPEETLSAPGCAWRDKDLSDLKSHN